MFLLHYYVDEKYTIYIFLTKYQFGKYLYFTFSPKLNKFLLKRKKKRGVGVNTKFEARTQLHLRERKNSTGQRESIVGHFGLYLP